MQVVWLVLLLLASQTASNPKPEIAKIQSNKVNHHNFADTNEDGDDDDDDGDGSNGDDYDDDNNDQVAKRQLDTYGSPAADPQIDSYGPPNAPICNLQVMIMMRIILSFASCIFFLAPHDTKIHSITALAAASLFETLSLTPSATIIPLHVVVTKVIILTIPTAS